MITIKIQHSIRKAIKWCNETFGPIPLVENKYVGMMVYDRNARWVHRMNKKGVFKFKNPNDAMLFKLRWM